jgi:hypothetical protein
VECGVGFRQLRTCRRARPGQLCAISDRCTANKDLLDHLIGAGDQSRLDRYTQCFRSLEVYQELELRRLLDREIARFCAPKNGSEPARSGEAELPSNRGR